MKLKKWICAALLLTLCAALASAQAATLERVWMEYEDYSGVHSEQAIEDAALLKELKNILLRAKDNPAQLEGCTMNCTLFCETDTGDIYDFACATDGCPYIQSRDDGRVFTLGVDYQRFWEIFDQVGVGMGYEASDLFSW